MFAFPIVRLQISLYDEKNVELASFHIEHGPGRGTLRRKLPVLEISTAGEEMADTIMLSFLYIEKVQRERLDQVGEERLTCVLFAFPILIISPT